MRFRYIFITIIIIIGCIVAHNRWNAWFYNPVEPPYSGLDTPGRVMLTFGNCDELSRNISWTYRKTIHHTTLRNLKPNTTYRYRITEGGKSTPWYTFRTQQPQSRNFQFIYIGDVQDTINGQTNIYLKNALRKFPETEFLVCGGDLIERPHDQYWAEAARNLDSIAQAIPILCVTGNHDYRKGLPNELDSRFNQVFSYFQNTQFRGNQVYMQHYGNADIFLLDSNRETPYLAMQRGWLDEQLKLSHAKWKIVVLHHPLHSAKGSMNNIIYRLMFDDLIREYNVDLVLQAHEHAYARMTNKTADNKPTTPVYTISHCAPKNYRIQFDDKFDKFGISSRYYQIIQASDDTLSVATYEVYEQTLYDSLAIIKNAKSLTINDFGKNIPEYMEFTPNPHSSKDQAFYKRIKEHINHE